MNTRESYSTRIGRVAAYIWDNLDRPLDLEKLADVACFSPYHFHRIYRMEMGETAAQTIRRLRLHRAAVGLSEGSAPLERIAKGAGYGSVEAFSRAFASAYGQPPAAYRARRQDPDGASPSFEPSGEGGQPDGQAYSVTVTRTQALRLAGFSHKGDYQTIGTTFDRLYAWAGPRDLVDGETRHIAVYYGDETGLPEKDLRSFAGITVTADFAPAACREGPAADTVDIPAGPVAVLRHTGPYSDLERAYRYLYGTWLAGSGHDPADLPCFEDYLNDPRTCPPTELLTDIYLPLAP